MSVYKKVPLPSKVICASAVISCPDEDMAIATDEGIYILSMQMTPGQPSPEIIMHISKIEPNVEVNEFDVDIDRDTIQQDIIDSGEIVGDFFEIMLNRTLSPAVESLQSNRGFVRASWSTQGADQVGRRMLATLTGDHRVSIYSRQGEARKWLEIVNISHMFQELMKAEGFLPAEERIKQNSGREKSKIVRLKERTYLLAATDLSWSGVFEDTATTEKADEPPSKRQKTTPTDPTTHVRKFCFLATALKSGHLGIWKVRLPVLSKKEVSFSELVDLHKTCPKKILWCESTAECPGFLAVGYQDGLVKLLSLKWLPDSMDLTTGDESANAWSDADNIPIYAIQWDTQRHILYFSKGPYLFAVMIEVTKSGEISVGKETHLAVSPSVFINDIKIQGGVVWVSTADDIVVMVKVSIDERKSVSLSLGPRVEPPRELSGPLYTWKNHGFVWSRNGAFMGILSSPGWNYCHLEIRKPLKFDILSRITPEEATDVLLDSDPDTPLTHCKDVLVYTQQVYRSTGTLPEILDTLVKDTEGWNTLSLFNLKLLRFLLQMENTYCKENPERKVELKELISRSTDLVLCSAAAKTLTKIWSKLPNTCQKLTKKDRLSSSLLSSWLKAHGLRDEDRALGAEVSKFIGTAEKETCVICEEDIPLTSIQNGTCANGHSFGRCIQTLVLCQDVPYRVCGACKAVAINKEDDISLLRDVVENACTLCDNTLLL